MPRCVSLFGPSRLGTCACGCVSATLNTCAQVVPFLLSLAHTHYARSFSFVTAYFSLCFDAIFFICRKAASRIPNFQRKCTHSDCYMISLFSYKFYSVSNWFFFCDGIKMSVSKEFEKMYSRVSVVTNSAVFCFVTSTSSSFFYFFEFAVRTENDSAHFA